MCSQPQWPPLIQNRSPSSALSLLPTCSVRFISYTITVAAAATSLPPAQSAHLFAAPPAQACAHNEQQALTARRPDLVQLWKVIPDWCLF